MNHAFRLAAASALGVILLTDGATAAVGAPLTTTQTASAVAQRATLTAKASVSSVQAREAFRITGTSTGLKPATKVMLQNKQGAKWVSLPAAAAVAQDGSYATSYTMRDDLGVKGKKQFRVVGGGAVSPVFTVALR
ncbi:hypothetical protein [Streptomyces roseochromogenus]|uniref:Uncharacterized protein n=1 Tax=Streptomyces roseochromogenus subsp. oscitans DS 12.976 TaxID=1352936 RepID=V6JNX2_STRRC|nr:hypothetical protein [Streptomyces roseochromogenus]EST18534.1 hypothetical protein M878_45270 [Streptomyces roseochromogenus subsp. oscitans DS 12.976]